MRAMMGRASVAAETQHHREGEDRLDGARVLRDREVGVDGAGNVDVPARGHGDATPRIFDLVAIEGARPHLVSSRGVRRHDLASDPGKING